MESFSQRALRLGHEERLTSFRSSALGVSFICPEEDETTNVYEAFEEKFEMDFESFAKLIDALLPMCVMTRSPLDKDKIIQGFGKDGLF